MRYLAADVLNEHSITILDEIATWVRTTYPSRTNAQYKCRRDLKKVIYSVINGLRFNNSEDIQFMADEFYFNGSLQLSSTGVEVEAYNILKTKISDLFLSNIVETGSIEFAHGLIDNLKTQLTEGHIPTDMNPVKASLIAERCQRNWDETQPVSDEDFNKIINAATAMPAKQNRKYYKLVVSRDPLFNSLCYQFAIDPTNPDFDRPLHRNSQVLAPLLLMYVPADQDSIIDPFSDDFYKNFHTSIGLSAGVAAHAAAELGYRTGFCACATWTAMYDTIHEQFGVPRPPENFGLMLGIGKPHPDYNRQDVVVDGVYGYTLDDSQDKIVDIHFVNREVAEIGLH